MTFNDSQKTIICDTIEKLYPYFTKNEAGYYSCELYADYDDAFSDTTASEIINTDNPDDKFFETLQDVFEDYEMDEKCKVTSAILDDIISSSEKNVSFGFISHEQYCKERNLNNDSIAVLNQYNEYINEIKNNISDYIEDKISMEYPCNHYYNQEFCIDIFVDTGDLNYDYVLNDIYPHYNSRSDEKVEDINDKASLVWLVNQQGYTKQDLYDACRAEEKNTSTFLESVRDEIINTSTHMNCLVFMIKSNLKDIIKLKTMLIENKKQKADGNWLCPENRTGAEEITIAKNTDCGLFDAWNGAGGCLEIVLEKDVVLPLKYVDNIEIDGACTKGYGIKNTYGVTSELWRNTLSFEKDDNTLSIRK